MPHFKKKKQNSSIFSSSHIIGPHFFGIELVSPLHNGQCSYCSITGLFPLENETATSQFDLRHLLKLSHGKKR